MKKSLFFAVILLLAQSCGKSLKTSGKLANLVNIGDTLNANNQCKNVSFNSRPSADRNLLRVERDKYADNDAFFARFDSDNDSILSSAEVRTMVSVAGVSASNQPAAAQDFYNDYNCDGVLGIDVTEIQSFKNVTDTAQLSP